MKPEHVELLARIELDHQAHCEKEAVCWIVVCVDTENGDEIAHGVGVYNSSIEAVVGAARLDTADREDGTTGWAHVVIPVFKKEEEKS
jgi:hypothetical protein